MSYRVGPVTGAKIKAGPHGPPDDLNLDGYFFQLEVYAIN